MLRLKQLETQELIGVQDVGVLRWPQYATAPQAQEHVTDEGSKASSSAKKFMKAGHARQRAEPAAVTLAACRLVQGAAS